jgi:hypothetical protein
MNQSTRRIRARQGYYQYILMIAFLVGTPIAMLAGSFWKDSQQPTPRPSYEQILDITSRIGDQPGESLGFVALTPSGNQVLIPYEKDSMFDRGSQPKHVLQRVLEGQPPIYKTID